MANIPFFTTGFSTIQTVGWESDFWTINNRWWKKRLWELEKEVKRNHLLGDKTTQTPPQVRSLFRAAGQALQHLLNEQARNHHKKRWGTVAGISTKAPPKKLDGFSGSAIRTSLLVRINPKNQQQVYHLSLMVFRVDWGHYDKPRFCFWRLETIVSFQAFHLATVGFIIQLKNNHFLAHLIGDRLIPERSPLWVGFRGIWRMWAPLNV